MIQAMIKGQYNALNAKDNKERLRYMVAGIKDGKFYDFVGTNYGVFDENVEDTEFIKESDLELSRITGAKIASITIAMQKFFDTYNGVVVKEDAGPETTDVIDSDEDASDDVITDGTAADEEADYQALEKACKKAIKKGDVKKASKIIKKLEGRKSHKKLSKKLKKVSE